MYDAQSSLPEEGTTELHKNGIDWVYTTQKQNASISSRRDAAASYAPVPTTGCPTTK